MNRVLHHHPHHQERQTTSWERNRDIYEKHEYPKLNLAFSIGYHKSGKMSYNVGQDLTKIANFFTFWFVFTLGKNMYTNLFPLILTYQPKLA